MNTDFNNLSESEKIEFLAKEIKNIQNKINVFKEQPVEESSFDIKSKNINFRIEPKFNRIDENNIQLELFPELKREYQILTEPKYVKFKNIIANAFVTCTKYYSFKKSTIGEGKIDWYNLAHKVGVKVAYTQKNTKKYYTSIIDSFTKIAESYNVTLVKVENKINNTKEQVNHIKESFYLVGNKRTIKKLQNKFSNTLNILGFEANDLYHDTHKTNFLSEEEVKNNINEDLKTLQFLQQDGKYINQFIRNLDDSGKASTIETALWPTILEKINQGVHLTSIMDEFVKNNKYLLIIKDFAEKNNMSPEDVTNILELDPQAWEPKHLLSNKKGIDKIQKNYDAIMENIHKLSKLAEHNNLVMSSLVEVTEDMKRTINDLNIPKEKKESIINNIENTVVFESSSGYTYKYSNIKKNIQGIIESKKIKP